MSSQQVAATCSSSTMLWLSVYLSIWYVVFGEYDSEGYDVSQCIQTKCSHLYIGDMQVCDSDGRRYTNLCAFYCARHGKILRLVKCNELQQRQWELSLYNSCLFGTIGKESSFNKGCSFDLSPVYL